MASFDDYKDSFGTIKLDRSDSGVLTMQLHSNGESLKYSVAAFIDMYHAFWAIANDRENRVIILTGTGDEFSGPRGGVGEFVTHDGFQEAYVRAVSFHAVMLSIDVPIIAAINGPAWRHAEIPLLCDIVLATPDTCIQDSGHFEPSGFVPGDGINILMPLLMGFNRARYFHLTGQTLDAQQCVDYGLVSEIVERDDLLPRAHELADHFTTKQLLLLRFSKSILVEPIREAFQRYIGHGMALEGLAYTEPEADRR